MTRVRCRWRLDFVIASFGVALGFFPRSAFGQAVGCLAYTKYVPLLHICDCATHPPGRPVGFLYNGSNVQANWEHADQARRLKVYVHTEILTRTDYKDPTNNPKGEIYVHEFHLYYPRNQFCNTNVVCGVTDHEHDWEWVYVYVVPVGFDGVRVLGATLSSHDGNNDDATFYWADNGTDPPGGTPTVTFVGTHPVVYVGCGNANFNTGQDGETIPIDSLRAGAELSPEDSNWSECGTSQGNIFYGDPAIGLLCDECGIPRTVPWQRGKLHWESPDHWGLSHTYDPYYNRDCVAEFGCYSWSCVKQFFLRFHNRGIFAKRAQGYYGRPNGLFACPDGLRYLWSNWGPDAPHEFKLEEITAAGLATVAACADSGWTEPTPQQPRGQMRVTGTKNGQTTKASAALDQRFELKSRVFVSRDVIDFATPSHNGPGGPDGRMYAITMDGYLQVYHINGTMAPEFVREYDMRPWGIFQANSRPNQIVAGVPAFYYPGGAWEFRTVVGLSCDQEAVVVDLTDESAPAVIVRSGPWSNGVSIDGEEGVLYSAAESGGLQIVQLRKDGLDGPMYGQVGTATPPVGLEGYEVRSVYSLGSDVLYVGYGTVGSGGARVGYLSKGVRQGNGVGEVWRLGPPDDYESLLGTPTWRIDSTVWKDGHYLLSGSNEIGHERAVICDLGGSAKYEAWQESDLFRNSLRTWRSGSSILLGSGALVAVGWTLVYWPGQGYLEWSGAELRDLVRDAAGSAESRYGGGIAEEGFKTFGGRSMVVNAMHTVVAGGQQYIGMASLDWNQSADRFTISLYRVMNGGVSASVDDGGRVFGVGADSPARVEVEVTSSNPMRGPLEAVVRVRETSVISAEMFDASGRRIGTLARNETVRDLRVLRWDAVGEDGRRVRSGMYFLRVSAGPSGVCRKVVVLQ